MSDIVPIPGYHLTDDPPGFHSIKTPKKEAEPQPEVEVEDSPEPYTDRHLLNQIDAEIETAFDLGVVDSPTLCRTLLEGFRRKIAAQIEGRAWWEE